MTDSLLALLYFALLVGGCYGAGRFVLRFLLTPAAQGEDNFLERFVFAVPLGIGVWGFALLALGLCRLFVAPVFYALLALGVPGLVLLVRDGFATPRRKPTVPRTALDLAAGAVFFVIGLCTLIAALAPPGGLEWDALSYHLTVPATYVREHRIFYIPYDHHSNFPFLLQMLYALMLGVKSVGGAKLCHWLCGALLTASVYTFACRVHGGETGKRIGIVAALLVAASPIVIWEAGIAYVDLATALFTWLSVYALLLPKPRYTLSAVLMGFALGTKWTVLGFWGIVLVGIVGADWFYNRRLAAETVKRAAGWGILSFALAVPWLLRSYLFAGSPVYPYFYNIFGGHYWNAANAAQYAADQATLGLGKAPIMLLLAPWLANVSPTVQKFNEYPFSLAAALVPLLLCAPFRLGKFGKRSVALAVFALAGYVFWFFLVQGTRYFLPLLPAVALLAAETMVALWETGRGFARYAAAGIVAASAIYGARFASDIATPAARVVFGTQTRADYVSSNQFFDALYPACAWINENTPRNSKVALFDVTFGFYLDRPILWANPNHAYNLIPWDSYSGVDDWLADFKRRGYTTLLTDDQFAPKPDAPNAGQRWRALLQEAVVAGKVTVAFEKEELHEGKASRRFVRVYRIL